MSGLLTPTSFLFSRLSHSQDNQYKKAIQQDCHLCLLALCRRLPIDWPFFDLLIPWMLSCCFSEQLLLCLISRSP